jgi:Flp pilus assembly protein TadD
MQPLAPFGEYAPFTLAAGGAAPAAIPAAPALAAGGFAAEIAAVARGRAALRALDEGRPEEARAGFEALLAESPPVLDPARLALGAALARFELGDFAGAESALAPAVAEAAPIDVRVQALSLRALCADRLGRREDAAAGHRAALALVEAHPEWNVFGEVAALARQGAERAAPDGAPALTLFALGLPF